MKLERVCAFLRTCERAKVSEDGTQMVLKCPFCGDSRKSNHGHFSVKLEIEPGEPMLYMCFRADCGVTGVLNSDILQQLGCQDTATLLELSTYNRKIHVKLDKEFTTKRDNSYQIVNLGLSDNKAKLNYINHRLGTSFHFQDLKQFKIQLGLYEFLRMNYITKLAFKESFCDLLDEYTIGFVSMYSDYLICRDITKDLATGNRYTIYRIRGKATENDMKLYCIPTDIDLLDPSPADINIAEGTFSILGAYLHTPYGRDQRNSIWLANCGSGYKKSLLHVTKQFGLFDVNLHIWSDSEIKIKYYSKLLKEVQDQVNILSCTVYYNTKAEDFGVKKSQIKVSKTKLL